MSNMNDKEEALPECIERSNLEETVRRTHAYEAGTGDGGLLLTGCADRAIARRE